MTAQRLRVVEQARPELLTPDGVGPPPTATSPDDPTDDGSTA
ncbi:hypothetical protein [Streptomyces sp. NPDC020667]